MISSCYGIKGFLHLLPVLVRIVTFYNTCGVSPQPRSTVQRIVYHYAIVVREVSPVIGVTVVSGHGSMRIHGISCPFVFQLVQWTVYPVPQVPSRVTACDALSVTLPRRSRFPLTGFPPCSQLLFGYAKSITIRYNVLQWKIHLLENINKI